MTHNSALAAGATMGKASRDAPRPESRAVSLPRVLGFTALWALTHLIGAWLFYPELLGGSQVDPDGYMRLVRVRDLLENGAWYDSIVARSNWPYGESLHWTRPLDVLIVALTLPLRFILTPADALAAAGSIVSPFLHLLLSITAVWVIAPIVPGPERHLVMPAAFAQMGVLTYGSLGRADHHMLIFLFFTLSLGAWIRALLEPQDRRSAFLAGALTGAGIWVGPEALLPLALLFLSGAIVWIIDGEMYQWPNIRFCAGLCIAIAGALIIERPLSDLLAAEFDRVSVAHLHISVIALVFWLAAGARRRGFADAPPRVARVVRAVTGAALAVIILLALHPRFLQGPWEGVDPAVIAVWLSRVAELQPTFPRSLEDVGRFVSMLGGALLAIPFITVWWWREPDAKRRRVWLLLLTSQLVYVPLAAAQLRFSPYAGIIAAIAGVELLRRAFARWETVPGLKLGVMRLTLILGVLLWPIILGQALAGLLSNGSDASRAATYSCDLTRAAALLNDPEVTGAAPRTVAAFIDFGPEILYRTPHRIIAGPYHRNRAGIMDSHELLSTAEESRALDIARRRDVDLILLCPSRDMQYFSGNDAMSLYGRLIRGELPGWITEVPLGESGFRLYRVVPQDVAA